MCYDRAFYAILEYTYLTQSLAVLRHVHDLRVVVHVVVRLLESVRIAVVCTGIVALLSLHY